MAEAAVEDLGNFSGESFHSSEVDVLGLEIVDDEEYSRPCSVPPSSMEYLPTVVCLSFVDEVVQVDHLLPGVVEPLHHAVLVKFEAVLLLRSSAPLLVHVVHDHL